jgi:serine/threonine-protein kinase RIO1
VASDEDIDLDGEEALPIGKHRIVLIDFAQAVQKAHPEALNLMKRDVEMVNAFFGKFINVLENDELFNFIITERAQEVASTAEEWVDLGGEGEGEGEGDMKDEVGFIVDSIRDSESVGEVEDDESTIDGDKNSGSEVDPFDNASVTTSIKKGKWRFRRNFSDKEAFAEVQLLLQAYKQEEGDEAEAEADEKAD